MDPLWASIAEFWWIAPTAVGAGTLGWFGLRGRRGMNERRLGYRAARHQLREARSHVAGARVAARIARAELAHTQSEKAAGRASGADVATARRLLQSAQANSRSAIAAVRSRRLQVSAARAALPLMTDAASLPLAKLMAEHDAVTARWMDYETDPARLISFPTMSDARVPATATYLRIQAETRRLRPASPRSPMTAAEFAAYGDGVAALRHAFDTAEHEAWRVARAEGGVPSGSQPPGTPPTGWVPRAQDVLTRSVQVLTQAGEVFTIASEAISTRSSSRQARADRAEAPQQKRAKTSQPMPPGAASPEASRPTTTTPTPPPASAPQSAPHPDWPVPSRSSRRSE